MRSKKAIYNILTTLILQVVVLISGFIVPKLIIEAFGSEVNGLVASITQFLSYITLLESGIGPVICATLYKPIAQKDKQTIENILKASEKFFRIISLIFIVYLVILTVVYPLIVQSQFNYFYTLSLIIIISVSTFFEYYFGMTYKLYLQAEQKNYISSLIRTMIYLLNILAVIVLIKLNANIQIIKLVSGLIFIIRPIFQNIYVKKKYNINLKNADNSYVLEKKWDGLAQHIAAVIHNNTDITILTIFSRLSEVSVYSVYHMIVSGIKHIVSAFTGGIDAAFGNMIARNETKTLNKNFNMYEVVYFSIATILYTCTIILIVPFVKVYTLGINDANYIRPIFACLIVISEFIWTIRLPYSTLTQSAGHFKETKKGAWIETIINLCVSLILVHKFGIIGVSIGTLIAMLVRTVEFVYHTNKYILKRNIFISIKKILLIALETILIIVFLNLVPTIQGNTYFIWIMNSAITFLLVSSIVLLTNFIFYKKEFEQLFQILKNLKKNN